MFKCSDCSKTFLYAGRLIVSPEILTTTKPANGARYQYQTLEVRACPYCKSVNIERYAEPATKIVSVLSVEIPEVDAKLKEGYEVHELYAKTAILIKKELPKK